MVNAGYQENSSLTSCLKSVDIVILVILPMSKNAFIAAEQGYIESVAATACVFKENVKILDIEMISTRASKAFALRMLLGTSVAVTTSVLLASGQKTYIQDQSMLNSNLLKNGLPSGTLAVQSNNTHWQSADSVTSPSATTPSPYSSDSDSAATTSNNPIGAIVGGAVGGLVLIAVVVLVGRKRINQDRKSTSSQQASLNSSVVLKVKYLMPAFAFMQ